MGVDAVQAARRELDGLGADVARALAVLAAGMGADLPALYGQVAVLDEAVRRAEGLQEALGGLLDALDDRITALGGRGAAA